jgi:beta-lactam-binding protein with PASTA domain
VIEQRPRPGEQARLNAPVDLVLARPITVIVPDLRSGDRRAAAVTLTKVRLQLGETSDRESERPAGTVVEQTPQAGETVELGTPVQVWVAVPMRVEVPSVVGRQQPDALTMLRSGRLRIGSVQVRESAGARGAILEQRPQAGERVEVGSAVDVVLASPVKVAVPELRRSTRAESGRLLEARGLVLGTIGERVGTEFPGSIVDQQPGAGVRVDPGTPIAIWIAAPAPPVLIPPQVTPQLEVPDITGLTRAEAQALLAGRGLALGQATTTTTSNVTPDTVVVQQPSVGSRVPPGTSISVVIAMAPVLLTPVAPVDPVTVPSTSGMPLIWLLLGVALGAVGAGVAVKARVHGSHALPPSVTLAPHPDMRAEVALTSNGPFTRSELSLQPFPDAGHQTVSGSGAFGMIEVTEVR